MNTKEYIAIMLTKFRVKIQEKFYNKEEIDNKITAINSKITTVNEEMDNKITAIDSKITTVNEEMDNKITAIDSKITTVKEEIDNKITRIDSRITTVNNEAVHDNKNTLDKFSEDIDGNPLYSGKKIVADFDFDISVTDAEVDSAITDAWNEIGI